MGIDVFKFYGVNLSFSTEIHISRLFILNNLYKNIIRCDKNSPKYDGDGNEVTRHSSIYPYHITKKILMLLMFAPSNYKNRTNEHSFIKLTCQEIQELLNQHFGNNIPLPKLEKHLNMLATNFQTVHGNTNHLLKKIQLNNNETAYQFVYKHNWKKNNFIPDFGKITLKYEDLKKYDTKIPEMVIMSILIIASQTLKDTPNLILNEQTIEKAFKLNSYSIDKICNLLGVGKLTKFDKLTKNEKYLTDIQQDIKQEAIRGIHFNDYSIDKAYSFLEDFRVRFNWENIFKLKELIYHNITKLDRNDWSEFSIYDQLSNRFNKDFSKIKFYQWDDRVYRFISDKYNQDNQINCYFREHEMDCKKSLDLQSRYSAGTRSEKNYLNKIEQSEKEKIVELDSNEPKGVGVDQDNNSDSHGTIEPTPKKPNNFEKLAKISNFQHFCVDMRRFYALCKKKFKKLSFVFVIRDSVIEALRESENPNKETFIKELEKVRTSIDVFKSPIFTENYFNYLEMDDETIESYWILEDYDLMEKDTTVYEDDEKFSYFIHSLCETWSDMETYNHEIFVKQLRKGTENKILSNTQKRNVENTIESMKNKKKHHDYVTTQKKLLQKLDINHIIYYIFQLRKYDNIEDIIFDTKRNNVSQNLNHFYCKIINVLENHDDDNIFDKFLKNYQHTEEDQKLLNEYFSKNLNNDNYNQNVHLIEWAVKNTLRSIEEKKVFEQNTIKERNIILAKIEELGLSLDDIEKPLFNSILFDLMLDKITPEEIINKLLGY